MIYFLIPIFNEKDNLTELSNTLRLAYPGEGKTFVFVDDCSSDDSGATIKELLANEQVHVLRNEQNQGPGYSFNRGFNYILDDLAAEPHDHIVTLEGDNTSDPGILNVMLELRNYGFDLILASPYAQGGGFDQTTLFRKISSFGANLMLRLWFDVKVLTLSSFYRIYSVGLLHDIRNNYGVFMKEKGFISKVEILVKAIKQNAKIIEVPMVLNSTKRKGKSKMKVFKTILSYMRFFIKPGF